MNSVRPGVIVYKTKKDYSAFVPVTLNAGKDSLVSFPGPNDLFTKGELSLPVPLENGYLYDRRGINENVAFTEIRYEDYSSRKQAYSPKFFMSVLLDTDPILEMYDCGLIEKDIEETLNAHIRNKFKKCKRIK